MPEASSLDLLVLLCMGHFVGDFVLQHDRMAIEKCSGRDSTLPWRWWLAGHCSCHGRIVALLTGVPLLGLAEFVVHWLLDWSKCRFGFSLGFDQLLHLVCKVVWVAVLGLQVAGR
ncbi:MAG: DUF3307 domain-containing protein [Cyanobacteriota bacterium]|nr:DUF3307 domain-containing protein [Cyanobacteriota bacterium]